MLFMTACLCPVCRTWDLQGILLSVSHLTLGVLWLQILSAMSGSYVSCGHRALSASSFSC